MKQYKKTAETEQKSHWNMIIINDSLTRADAATQYKLLSTLIAQKHQMTVVQP